MPVDSMTIPKISDTVFRQYDIRGVYGDEIDSRFAELLGCAFGTYIRAKGEDTAIVGRDNRMSSPELAESVVRGLRATGIHVVDIGLVITPVFYFATVAYTIPSGIMVTASHNPAQYNGFKIQHGSGTLYGDRLQQLKELMKSGDFDRGEGSYTERSPVGDYTMTLADKIELAPGRRLKVVVDAGNGTAGLFAPQILEVLGCEVIPLYCDSDPAFPNHFPDPTRVANLQELIKTVRASGADVGLGFDGDGDRLGVVDENGAIIWGDMAMILFWREILPKHPGADVIVEVKCSELLYKEAERLGGKPMFYKTGHSLIKAKMKEIGALFTGEMSGHMFFADEYYGYDDAVYAAGRLLRILSHAGQPLSELLADVPKTFITPELHAACKESEKAVYVDKARHFLQNAGADIITVDGVRAHFEDGWGLVRASNTGPELVVRVEGYTEEARDRILALITEALAPLGIS